VNDRPEQAWIGLGSNLGDRLAHLRAARAADPLILRASDIVSGA